jgi:hypothetical protein
LTLGIALKIYGNKKWSKIANHLEGRTDIQCRERFCNILDPSLEEVNWTANQDIKLLSLYEKHGNKWSKIAREFGNRTDNTCWRRWKYLCSLNSPNKSLGELTLVKSMSENLSSEDYDDLKVYSSFIQIKPNEILKPSRDLHKRKNNSNITVVDSNLSQVSELSSISKRKKKVSQKGKTIFQIEKVNLKTE